LTNLIRFFGQMFYSALTSLWKLRDSVIKMHHLSHIFWLVLPVSYDQSVALWQPGSFGTLGPSIKNVRTKSQKIDPSPCPCGHIINFEKFEVFAPKSADVRISILIRKMSALNRPLHPLTADVFYGQPLTEIANTLVNNTIK